MGPSRVTDESHMPLEFISSYSKVDKENVPLDVTDSVHKLYFGPNLIERPLHFQKAKKWHEVNPALLIWSLLLGINVIIHSQTSFFVCVLTLSEVLI